MAIHRYVLHNGRILEASESILKPGQIGLLAGWGIFSTLRVEDGVMFAWERHWERMHHDATLLNVAFPSNPEPVRRSLEDLIQANSALNGTLRIVMVRNAGGFWEGPPTSHETDLIALTADRNHWGAGVRLMYQPEGRHSKMDFARAKMISWAQNLRWYERAHEAGFDECILLNELGEVCECTSANIFAVQKNQVFTPPLASGCLPGVTRAVLLEEIHAHGIDISERVLKPADIETADEVFITSTTRDLLPVLEIGDKKLNPTGEVCSKLLTLFRSYLGRYTAEHQSLYRTGRMPAHVAG